MMWFNPTIFKSKIEIVHDDIALIIYKGSKEDLPELFKNINTGSVALIFDNSIGKRFWFRNFLKAGKLKEHITLLLTTDDVV